MSARDCDSLLKLVENNTPAECHQAVEDWHDHGAPTFVAFEKVTRDGRDATILLVTARMRDKDKERPSVVRVRTGASFKIARAK
jgi:hypothetical protein